MFSVIYSFFQNLFTDWWGKLLAGVSIVIPVSLVTDFNHILNQNNYLFSLLLFTLVIDYISGVLAAIIKNEFNKSKAIKSVLIKMTYFLIILVAMVLDLAMTKISGVKIATATLGTISYLIGTEAVSSIKNIKKSNSKAIPPFLMVGVDKLKSIAEAIFKGGSKK